MSNVGTLPRRLKIGKRWYRIRTDRKDIFKIIEAFLDPNLPEEAQMYICMKILYIDYDSIPRRLYNEAAHAAMDFINQEKTEIDASPPKSSPKTMDWIQDEPLLFSSVNKVAGFETRNAKYIHWWTFLGWLMEIDEGTYKYVLYLRNKKAKGKKLEKEEREFWNANKDICVIKNRLSDEEQARKNKLNAIIEKQNKSVVK